MTPPITALGSRYGIQGALGRSVKRAAAGGGWWDLNGTITSCVAAYQPKGAASYAASLADLSGTGNNATEGTAPGWDVSYGWSFVGANSQFLKTGIIPTAQTYSYFIRYSDLTLAASILFGFRGGTGRVQIQDNGAIYNGTSQLSAGIIPTSGVIGIAGTDYYEDAVDQGDIPGSWGDALEIYIAARNFSTMLNATMKTQAFAIYNATLTPTQVGLLTTAMAAL